MNIKLVINLLVVGLIGCAPASQTTKFTSKYPSRTTAENVRIYQTKTPTCEYEELGRVSARQRNKFISMDAVMQSLREQASSMGGDAIVAVSETSEEMGSYKTTSTSTVVDNDPVLSGVVIRFENESCMK